MRFRRADRDVRLDWRWVASVAAIAAGAAAFAYLFDPELGRSRRLRLAAQSAHVVRHNLARARRRARYMLTTASLVAEHRLFPIQPQAAAGRTLLDRVESELYTDRRIPHGRMNVEVEGSTVVLRGQLDTDAEITRVRQAAAEVRGVQAVRSFLHLPGSPAPNKVAALRASAAAAAGD